MKAQRVFENIAFKRGIGSKESLNVGTEKIREDWWNDFVDLKDPIDLFAKLMLGFIKRYTDFTKSWTQSTSTGEKKLPGKVSYILERPHPSKRMFLYISIDEEGEITWNNGLRRLGNFRDLAIEEDRLEFIENLKEIDDYPLETIKMQ